MKTNNDAFKKLLNNGEVKLIDVKMPAYMPTTDTCVGDMKEAAKHNSDDFVQFIADFMRFYKPEEVPENVKKMLKDFGQTFDDQRYREKFSHVLMDEIMDLLSIERQNRLVGSIIRFFPKEKISNSLWKKIDAFKHEYSKQKQRSNTNGNVSAS